MKIASLVLIMLFAFGFSEVSAQKVSGEWYGVGKVKKAGDHNSYLSEMILKQKGNLVTGKFNYFYRNAEIKTKVSGKYNPKYKVLELNARPILNFMAKNSNGADCPMEGSFTLSVTKTKTTLIGQFNPTYEYRITCPAIDINFVKSDPKATKAKEESIADDDSIAAPIITKRPAPIAKVDSIKKTNRTVTSTVAQRLDTTTRRLVRPDSVTRPNVIVRPPIVNKPITIDQQKSLALKQRAFDVTQVIDVDADSLKISLYDNGEVDNDSISLFYNRKLVASNQMLSDKPFNINLALTDGDNEIAIYAENLGKIPPNTALAIIYAGEQRFELTLTSTFSKNAAIKFRRKSKKTDPKNIN